MLKGLATNPLIVGGAFFVAAMMMWRHRSKLHLLRDLLFTASAAMVTLAIPPWRDTLAWLTATHDRIGALLIVSVGVFAVYWLRVVRGHGGQSRTYTLLGHLPFTKKATAAVERYSGGTLALRNNDRPERHHRIHNPVVAVMTGCLLVVWIGGARLLADAAASSVVGAGQALLQSNHQISSGKAAAQVSAAQARDVLLIVGGIIVAFIQYLRHGDKEKKDKQGNGRLPKGGIPGAPTRIPGGSLSPVPASPPTTR